MSEFLNNWNENGAFLISYTRAFFLSCNSIILEPFRVPPKPGFYNLLRPRCRTLKELDFECSRAPFLRPWTKWRRCRQAVVTTHTWETWILPNTFVDSISSCRSNYSFKECVFSIVGYAHIVCIQSISSQRLLVGNLQPQGPLYHWYWIKTTILQHQAFNKNMHAPSALRNRSWIGSELL